MSTPILEVQLRAGYGKRTTLDNVRFAVAPGDRVGVVGGSGAGKSTLVLALLGLLPWRKGWVDGQVLLRGKDLLRCSEKQLREIRGKELALVPQSPASSLNPALSLDTHFREMWRAHSRDGSALEARRSELLLRVGLPADRGFLQRKPAQISIGQAQRVVIALALLHRPSLLVADEPTSALDVCTQREVIQLLRDVCQDQEAALLYVSHDLLTVFHLCHRMLVIDRGELVEEVELASVDTATTQPATRRLLDTLPVAPHMLTAFAM